MGNSRAVAFPPICNAKTFTPALLAIFLGSFGSGATGMPPETRKCQWELASDDSGQKRSR